MLKVYNVYNYYQLDDGDWTMCAMSGQQLLDNPPEEVVKFHDLSWYELWDHLHNCYVPDIFPTLKGFKQASCIAINNWGDDKLHYFMPGDFNKIAFKQVYKEWNDVPLDFIIRRCPADQAIQYLRERGLGLTVQN